MNTDKVIAAIDTLTSGLSDMKDALLGKTTTQVESHVNTELLANKLAYSYKTFHPEYKIESQFNNLKDMINCSKISYVINWVRRKGTEGLEGFFKLNEEEKRAELNKALTMFEKEIKQIFTKRFKDDSNSN